MDPSWESGTQWKHSWSSMKLCLHEWSQWCRLVHEARRALQGPHTPGRQHQKHGKKTMKNGGFYHILHYITIFYLSNTYQIYGYICRPWINWPLYWDCPMNCPEIINSRTDSWCVWNILNGLLLKSTTIILATPMATDMFHVWTKP